MKNITIVATVLALVLVVGPVSAEKTADQAWLHGSWELTYDPDGSPKDVITFRPDGSVTVASSGTRISGEYSVSGDRVDLRLRSGDRTIVLHMTAAAGRTKLLLYSDRTGNTAEYAKIE